MRKFLKGLFSVMITLYFSANMFYCFVAGAPSEGSGKSLYFVSAAGLSLLMPGFGCGCIHYIRHLHKELDKQERK